MNRGGACPLCGRPLAPGVSCHRCEQRFQAEARRRGLAVTDAAIDDWLTAIVGARAASAPLTMRDDRGAQWTITHIQGYRGVVNVTTVGDDVERYEYGRMSRVVVRARIAAIALQSVAAANRRPDGVAALTIDADVDGRHVYGTVRVATCSVSRSSADVYEVTFDCVPIGAGLVIEPAAATRGLDVRDTVAAPRAVPGRRAMRIAVDDA